ncbi:MULTISPECIES: hypothetical protein [Staphylococcus]|uniref:hypothetical protein n=1 Tax=Staphylococcus TaxID=1279 RepID=UPI00066148D6|nr:MULTISPECIES: hypothetical protein [Staphylococcus]MDW3839775.1 hypothetical protein [Staphylococcus saprophyticus]MDW3940879.1 hypothetical protein [Staphylococcus saprophyticus]MDW3986193.1 hypothetical protein [Staphylococcus saprophyticus]MDW4236745.1 hypothetical protein [Staphylococcus saprophyticus]MDW4241687.1 hypothetical protein [Staphylococcus saprophyticus]
MDKNNSDVQIDQDLVGYGICVVLLVIGILFSFLFTSWLFFIGLIIFFLGFIFLAVQLDSEKYTKYSLLTLGLGFLFLSLFLVNIDFIIVRIIFVLFLALAITFFVVNGIYIARNSEENKSVSVIVFQIIDIGAALVSIFNLIKEVLGWMS